MWRWSFPAQHAKNSYGWLGQFPKIREWIGDRTIMNLAAHSYVVVNRKFESTISVDRTAIETISSVYSHQSLRRWERALLSFQTS